MSYILICRHNTTRTATSLYAKSTYKLGMVIIKRLIYRKSVKRANWNTS